MSDTPGPRDKLIAAKQAWAKSGRLLTGQNADPAVRTPPGQRLTQDWPVLDLGEHPKISPASFVLDVDGAVGQSLHLDFAALMALPQTQTYSDMHCVTAWSRLDNEWSGIAARTLLEQVKPHAEARHVVLHASDGYTTNIRLDQFDQPDVMLVHGWNGAPLDKAHGGPLRVLIPRLYLWKSAKWIRRIEFTAQDRPGFWETRGYHNNADPWQEERYS